MSWKQYEIRPKLLLMTNRKLHMRFRLAPRLMTLVTLNCYKFKFFRNFALDSVTVKNEREQWFNELCPIYQGYSDLTFALARLLALIFTFLWPTLLLLEGASILFTFVVDIIFANKFTVDVKATWWECQAAGCGSRSVKHLQHFTHGAKSCRPQPNVSKFVEFAHSLFFCYWLWWDLWFVISYFCLSLICTFCTWAANTIYMYLII